MNTNDTVLAFLQWASIEPHRTALSDAKTTLSYAELQERAMAQSAQLQMAGVSPGDIVGVFCDRTVGSVVSILSALAAGAAYLPLDLTYPTIRLAQMIEDSQPRLLVVQAGAELQYSPAPGIPIQCVTPEVGYQRRASPIAADDGMPAYVLFTSGSTGRPKGAVLSRRALGHMVSWHVRHPRFCTPARTLQFATLGFDSSVRDLFATFASGGTLLMADEQDRHDPFRLLKLMHEQRIERTFLPYVALRAIANAYAESGVLPTSLRDLMTGGEALMITPAIRQLFAALPEAVLYNEYGPTESCVFVTSKPLSGDSSAWPERPDIGDPLDHVKLFVADDQLHLTPDGCDGELLIGGESLADEYIHRPGLTAERFVQISTTAGTQERVYRSGDRVRREGDGRITFLGREDDQVKIAGYRVELGEVEAALTASPLVREVAVVAPVSEDGRRLVAHVVPASNAPSLSELHAQLMRHMAGRLPAFARPRQLVFHEHLPLTPNGKADRRRLEEETFEISEMGSFPPNAALEVRILAVWRKLLGQPTLRSDENVFDHGADSLRVMAFLTQLHALAIGRLSATDVYEFPTPRLQAQEVLGAVMPRVTTTSGRGALQRNALERMRGRHRKSSE